MEAIKRGRIKEFNVYFKKRLYETSKGGGGTLIQKFKIIKIDTLDQRFDPNIHQAMFEIENDEVEEGTILQVVQEGFKIEDRLLRPALVGVSKKTSK